MKKYLIVAILSCLNNSMNAQIKWFNDFTSAKAAAIANDKLILVDFWATWCRPCLEMDRVLWNSPEMEKYKDSFVFLKVDIDMERAMANNFQVNGIPHLALVTVNEDRISEKTGFINSVEHLKYLAAFPNKLDGLNNALLPLVDNKKATGNDYFSAGIGFQVLAFNIEDKTVKRDFFNFSETYYIKCLKTNTELAKRVELLTYLNQANLSKAKKVIEKLKNLPSDYFEKDLEGLRDFVLAISYKEEGQKVLFEELKSKITDEFYLAVLNK
jgi:thiol-disulfide isomerase/thioredoxin